MNQISARGVVLILSSPSGAGKTTLTRMLRESDSRVRMSVSVTTRKPRPSEREGEDYYFVDEERFAHLRDRGELLEWAKVFGNWYGTPYAPIRESLRKGRDILLDIDWQGTQQLQKNVLNDLVRIFILPPSAKELYRRLRCRGQDSEGIVAARMAQAASEIGHWDEYDYIVVNREPSESLTQIKSILIAERSKRMRQTGLSAFVREIQKRLPAET